MHQNRTESSCLKMPLAARRRPGIHGWRSNSESVRRLYAGPAGAILRTLSHLSLHVPLSKYWLRDHTFDLRGATRILDAGCGAGQLTEHLAQYAASDASITGCDFSIEMLLCARQRLRNPMIQFVLGDLTQLPFADGSFDCVTCGYVLEHLSDARPGLAELARVLTPGGRLLLLTTEDKWTGSVTANMWHCRTYNRRELQHHCHELGLIWKQELWFSSVHQRLGFGGICVEIERQTIHSEECRRYENASVQLNAYPPGCQLTVDDSSLKVKQGGDRVVHRF